MLPTRQAVTRWAAFVSALFLFGWGSVAQARVAYSPPLSGIIDFGLSYHDNGRTIDVTQPRLVFQPGDTLAYVAHLSRPPHMKKLHWTIAQVSPKGQETVMLDDTSYPVQYPKTTNVLYNRFKVSDLSRAGVTGPGKFVMRFSRGSLVLAKGTFRLSR